MINLIYTLLPIITMIIGFYFGFNLKKEDKLPEIKTPIQIIEEQKKKKKENKENEELETFISNIDNYPENQQKIKE